MGLFDSIFGSAADQAAVDYFDTSELARQQALTAYNNIGYNQYSCFSTQAQSQAQLYNNALAQARLYRNEPKWVFNGVECNLKEFTELMFPDDEQARLMFILKHGGV